MTSAEHWNAAGEFTDASGNGRAGRLTAGTVNAGVLHGHGASIPVPYVGGDKASVIE
jgi:hypothetical protein